jgi:hypothetical protein
MAYAEALASKLYRSRRHGIGERLACSQQLQRSSRDDFKQPSLAIVTGASSGIGYELARQRMASTFWSPPTNLPLTMRRMISVHWA